MGRIISKGAAIPRILGDVGTTLEAAAKVGGAWHDEAQRLLAPSARRALDAELARTRVQEAFELEKLGLAAASRAADLACASVRDEVWNKLGRPADNAELAIAFPSPMKAFFALRADDKADRIEVIAQLLESGTIQRLSAQDRAELAATLRAQIPRLLSAHEAWEKARKQKNVRVALRNGFVLSARVQLAHLKRAYKVAGFSEADIHRVIPDRKKHPVAAEPPVPLVPVEPELPPVPVPRVLISVAPEPEPVDPEVTDPDGEDLTG